MNTSRNAVSAANAGSAVNAGSVEYAAVRANKDTLVSVIHQNAERTRCHLTRPALTAFAALSALTAFSGCMSEFGTVLDPLGPVPGLRAATIYPSERVSRDASLPQGQGALLVATPTGLVYSEDQMYFPHLSYFIESEKGWPVKCVPNHLHQTDEVPQEVPLPVGRYVLIAEADGLGKVKVPIQIASGMLTKVTLQRFRGENDVW